MTILQALEQIDELVHNTYSQEQKIGWLSDLDAMVKEQVIDTHEGAEEVIFTGYDGNTPMDTVLLVPTPYQEVYLHYLEGKICYYNGEQGKYNQAMEQHKAVLRAFVNHYNATHMAKGHSFRYF
jgi:hypothetical protein